MPTVLGVDGYRGGWVAALVDVDDRSVAWVCARSLRHLLDLEAAVVAVDVPIGLPDGAAPRSCDLAARRRLVGRGSTVFPAPARAVLAASSYDEAREIARGVTGRSVTRQTYNILHKVRDADAVASDRRVIEVHPEVSFAAMAGAPLLSRKRSSDGRRERLALLRGWLGDVDVPPGDDAVDALAAAWTATRWYGGTAEVLGDGQHDTEGRPMRIVV